MMEFNTSDTLGKNISDFIKKVQAKVPKAKPAFKKMGECESLTEIHTKSKSIYPECFEGAKLFAIREVLGKVRTVQQYDYGGSNGHYRPFENYIHNEFKHASCGTVCSTKLDSTGAAGVMYEDALDENYKYKFETKIQQMKSASLTVGLDRADSKNNTSISLNIENFDVASSKIVSQFLQKLTRNVSVGAEVVMQPLRNVVESISLSGQYHYSRATLSSTIGNKGCQVCFSNEISAGETVAAIFDKDFDSDRSTFSVAYKYCIQGGGIFKIFCDSNRHSGLSVEKIIHIKDLNEIYPVLKVTACVLLNKQLKPRVGLGLYAYL